MENLNTLRIKGLKVCEIPNVLACLPEGTYLVPASNFDENAEGWIILPPESAMKSEGTFESWKDSIYNSAIDLGLKQIKRE